jgi:hypothetical protein
MNSDETEIPLVEDSQNQSDVTLQAWQRENLAHHLATARHGEDSLKLRFCRGALPGGPIEPRSRAHAAGVEITRRGRDRSAEADQKR